MLPLQVTRGNDQWVVAVEQHVVHVTLQLWTGSGQLQTPGGGTCPGRLWGDPRHSVLLSLFGTSLVARDVCVPCSPHEQQHIHIMKGTVKAQ